MFKFLIPIIILTICFQNGCKENTNLNKKIEVSKSEKSASGLEIGKIAHHLCPFMYGVLIKALELVLYVSMD